MGSLLALCGFDSRPGHRCGHRPTVGPQPSKLTMRVRSPLSAPRAEPLRGSVVCNTIARGLDSLSALRPACSMDEPPPSKRSPPGSSPGRGTSSVSSSRSRTAVPQIANAGSTPASDAKLPVLTVFSGPGLRSQAIEVHSAPSALRGRHWTASTSWTPSSSGRLLAGRPPSSWQLQAGAS